VDTKDIRTDIHKSSYRKVDRDKVVINNDKLLKDKFNGGSAF
jgi:hypothetical protein